MKILILGAGAFAREVYNWVHQAGHEVIGFYASQGVEPSYLRGLPIYYGNAHDISTEAKWIIGVGNATHMRKMVNEVSNYIEPADGIIHPNSVVGDNVVVGKGSIICPATVISCDVTIGSCVAINIGCTIGHDVIIQDFVHLSPNTSLSGGTLLVVCVT